MTETPDFPASFNVHVQFQQQTFFDREDGGDTIEYATKMLGGESQLVNWVRGGRIIGLPKQWRYSKSIKRNGVKLTSVERRVKLL